MNTLKKIIRLVSISFLSLLFANKSKASSLSSVDKRIEKVRKAIKNELEYKDGDKISIPFKNYTNDNTWVNWGNWGNWNNWNNWVNWNNWGNWGNWRNY